MARNTTKIEMINGKKTMVKTMPENMYLPAIYEWENQLCKLFPDDGDFHINKVLNHEKGILHLDYIDFKPKPTSNMDLKLFGSSMAKIHNSGRDWSQGKTLTKEGWIPTTIPIKTETYSSMKQWSFGGDGSWLFLKSRGIRTEIFNTLPKYNYKTQPKAMLHRDFRLHNILYDDRGYHLIDFDFAAVDYIAIELMGLYMDIYEYHPNAAMQFLEGYKSESVDWEWSTGMLDMYLCYLCTNTFPFSMANVMDIDEVEALSNERNHRLKLAYENKKHIQQQIEDTNENK